MMWKNVAFLAAILALSSGCAGIKALMEKPDLRVTLERLDRIEDSLEHGDRLLLRTPISATSKWVDELSVGDDQIRDSYRGWMTSEAARAGASVMPTDIYATSWSEVGKQETHSPEAARNLILLLGGQVASEFDKWEALVQKKGQIDGRIEEIEAELDRDELEEAKKFALKTELKAKEEEADKAEDEVDEAKAATLLALESADLGVEPVLAERALKAYSYLNYMYLNAASLGTVELLQYGRGLADIQGQMEGIVKDWISRAVAEQTGTAPDLSAAKIGLDVSFTKPPSILIDGVDIGGVDMKALTETTAKNAWQFIKDVVTFPVRYGMAMAKVAARRALLTGAREIVETKTGLESPSVIELDVSIATKS